MLPSATPSKTAASIHRCRPWRRCPLRASSRQPHVPLLRCQMQRCPSIVVIVVLGVVLGIASGEYEKRWRTSLSLILMSLGLKKRRQMSSICEREREREKNRREHQSQHVQQ